ncbi:hypothetical protein A2U01_0069423, partial [Trifolium medium]|nr:hypothetical protein [Trifolium medium]
MVGVEQQSIKVEVKIHVSTLTLHKPYGVGYRQGYEVVGTL